MKTLSKIIAALVAFCVASVSQAAQITCVAGVSSVGVEAGGAMYVSTTTMPIHTVCNTITQGSYAMNPQACKLAYATALAARLASKNIKLGYNGPANCSSIAAWSAQTTFYFAEIL
jgi:hypothetical protein